MAGVGEKKNSAGIALRMQKKLLGMTIKSKGAVKNFVDENTGPSPIHNSLSPYAPPGIDLPPESPPRLPSTLIALPI